MDFKPNYIITERLLANIKRITRLVSDLNSRSYAKVVLIELEQRANSLSVFASTSIEGNPLPLTDVKRLLKTHPKTIRDSEKEVLNYNRALQKLNKLTAKKEIVLDAETILSTQTQVVDGLMIGSKIGIWRNEPVFVHNPKTSSLAYLPPNHKDVPKLMADLIQYVAWSKESVDPLIVAGIFHKQFVIIHPFLDGNGRTARLITKLLLARMGLNTFNLFSFENYYNHNVTTYFDYVGVKGNYYDIADSINFTEWLEYFTDGIIDELLRVSKELARVISTPQTTLKDHHKKIIDYINEHGFITDAQYANLTKRARPTRHKDLRRLIELGLIQKHGAGKATYYKLLSSE